MTDSYTTNAGSGGNTFASDDISNVHYARVKVSKGRDGVAADVGSGFFKTSAASTNATSVKGSAGTLFSLTAVNLNAAVRYIRFYNLASAPTVGTSTMLFELPIPASTTGAGFSIDFGPGVDFSTGIAYALTTGVGQSDTGAVAANEIFLVGTYV